MPESLSWNTLEHHHTEKSSDWYWSFGIIAVCLAILCIVFNNILFGIFILVAAFVAGLHAGRPPKTVHVELGKKGIVFGHRYYPYRFLDSFWVEEHEHHQPVIILKSKSFFVPLIIIPIDEAHHDDVRAFLHEKLPQVEHKETIGHRILEYFGL